MGEFGRTPKVNANDGGRDHWNYCYSLMLAGGGIKRRLRLRRQRQDRRLPRRDPLTPGDIDRHDLPLLGIDPGRELHDRLRPPAPLVPEGDVIRELLA